MIAVPSWRPTLHYQTLAREYTMAVYTILTQQSYISPSRSLPQPWELGRLGLPDGKQLVVNNKIKPKRQHLR